MTRPIVKAKQGTLRGSVVENVDGGTYLSFRGIPYAEPPVGDLRFKDPQPPTPWTGIRDASEDGPSCAQSNFFTKRFEGEDDCLYLNVATTSLTESRPVMVWIHGGAFMVGSASSDTYSPDYLIKKDIVFVSINYRVGCLGFLNLDHEEAPGNQGLKDQVAALKWVKENIEAFGGDPNNVTIFGESAGGTSVHYHTISPLSKGLFHKAICQSGVAIIPFTLIHDRRKWAYRLAAVLGKETSDPLEAIIHLRTIPVEKLIEAQNNLLTPVEMLEVSFVFGPSLDEKSPQPFTTQSPLMLATKGVDVPFILGYNSHEGILFLSKISDEMFPLFDKHFDLNVPPELAAKAPSKVPEIAQEIKKLYFEDGRVTKDQKDNFVQCAGDLSFVNGIQQVVEYQREKNTPTYFYRFSFEGAFNFGKLVFGSDVKGTAHADELAYIFHTPKLKGKSRMEPGTPERIVLDRFVRMWTDFAKTGNPTPKVTGVITEKWLPVTATAKNYLEINKNIKAGVDPGKEKWDAWKRIYAMA